jgi:O-antigen/teichoic acid export membrane protein
VLSKSIVKVGLVGSGNILNAALGFAFLAAVAKTLDLDTFGKYALLTTLLVSISKLIDFGTNSVFVAKTISSENNKLFNLFLSTKVILTLLTLPVYVIALLLLHKLDLPVLIILMVGSIAYGINYALFGLFQKDERYLPLILLNLLPSGIKGVFALLTFLSLYKPDLTQAVLIFSLSILASCVLLPLVSKELRGFKFTLAGIRNFLKTSYPAGASQIITESWPTLSNAAAKITGGFSDVGIFSLASKISHIFALVSLSIFTVLLPKNANRKKQNLTYDFTETIIISVVIIAVAALAVPLATFFVQGFFGPKFQGSILILNILIFSAALTSIHAFVENYFFVEQKTGYIMYISMGKLAVFLSLCLILVPKFSLRGLAFSDLISSVFAVIFTVLLVRRSGSV